MRRRVRNEKVIRAMAIGLATMLATTSMPMTVFADEGDDQGTESTETTGPEAEESSGGSAVEIHIESEGVVPADVSDAQDAVTPAEEAVSQAQDEVPAQTTYDTTDLNQNLTDAAAAISDTGAQTGENAGGEGQVSENLDNAEGQLKILAGAMKDIDAIATDIVIDVATQNAIDSITQGVDISIQFDGYEQAVDALGNPVVDENGNPVFLQAVDAEGNLLFENELDAEGNPVIEKDAEGNPVFETDENGNYVMENGSFVYKTVKKPVYVQKIKATTPTAESAPVNTGEGTGENSGENQGQTGNTNVENTKSNLEKAEEYAKKAATLGQNGDNEDDANNNKDLAVEYLGYADDALAEAENDVKVARDLYKTLKDKADLAQEKAQKAEAAIKGAKEFSSEAVEDLNDAKEEAERLQGEAEKARQDYENKNKLVKEIYDAQQQLQKHVDERKAENHTITGGHYHKDARTLTKLLLEYYITTSDDYDVNSKPVIGDKFTASYTSGWELVVDDEGNPVLDDLGEGKYNYTYDEEITTIEKDIYKENKDRTKWVKDVVLIDGKRELEGGGNPNQEKNSGFDFIVVKYTNKDGEEVTKYFDYQPGEDGNPEIFERSFEYIESVYLEAKDAVAYVEGKDFREAKEEVPESWKTSDGSKTYAETGTSHTVDITDEEGNKTGFYAIDTANEASFVQNGDVDNLAPAKAETKTTTYVKNSEAAAESTYEHATYQVTTGYEQKTGPQNDNYKWGTQVINKAKNLVEEGYEVQIVCHKWIGGDEVKSYSKVDGWDKFVAACQTILTLGIYDSFTLSTTNTIDDHDKPIKEDREGIWETVTEYFTETIKDEDTITSGKYGKGSGDGKKDAENAMNNKLNELAAKGISAENGYTINSHIEQDLGGWLHDDKSWYVISYTKTTTNENVAKVTSRKLYNADTYTNYNPYSAADPGQEYVAEVPLVIGNPELKTQEIKWESVNESYNKAKENGTLKKDHDVITAGLKDKNEDVNLFDRIIGKIETALGKANELDGKIDNIVENNFDIVPSTTLVAEEDDDLEYIPLNYKYKPAEGSKAEEADNILDDLKKKLDVAEGKLSALKEKVKRVTDFISNIEIAKKTSSGTGTDEPGKTDDEPGKKDDEPGKKDDEPGKKDDDPGKKDEDPGKKDDEPGKKDDDPGKKDDDPSKKDDDPGKKDDDPGKKDDDPGKKDDDPGKKDDDPGKKDDDPGKKDDDPGKKDDKPGKKDDKPGKKDDDPGRRDPGTGGDPFIGGGTGGDTEDSPSSSPDSTPDSTPTIFTFETPEYLGTGEDLEAIPLLPLTDTGRGRTVAGRSSSRSGVLGVRTGDEVGDPADNTKITKPEEVADDFAIPDKNKKNDQASAKQEIAKVTKNIKENKVPLDATASEPGPGVNLLLLAIVAAAGTLGFVGYEKQKRRVKATNDKEKKK